VARPVRAVLAIHTVAVRRLASLVSAVAWLAACGDAAGPEREISGEQIFARYCSRCHGVDGKGTTETPGAGDLSHRPTMDRMSDGRLRQIIMMGHKPKMPSFYGQFTEASLRVLIAHVRSLSGSSGPHGGHGQSASPPTDP
jgi:mono/diheme cytochrome c family protein